MIWKAGVEHSSKSEVDIDQRDRRRDDNEQPSERIVVPEEVCEGGEAEKQECKPFQKQQPLDEIAYARGTEVVKSALSIPAAIGGGPLRIDCGVPFQPLLNKYSGKYGVE